MQHHVSLENVIHVFFYLLNNDQNNQLTTVI